MRISPQIMALGLFCLLGCNQQPSELNADIENKASSASRTIIDLSHSYSEETVYWVTAKEFEMDTVFAGTTDQGYYYSAFNFSTAEHGGTHIDAPIHFSERGLTVDEIPLENLVGPAIKVDVSNSALADPDYLIGISDLQKWETENDQPIPEGAIVLLQTGYSTFYPDRKKYMGTDQKGEAAVAELHFPGLSAEAATWLVEERSIHAIGIDTPSIDYGQSADFRSHVILMSQNIPAFENLTNLEQLPTTGFEVVALPMKIQGGSGAPLRIIALTDDQ